MEPRREARAIAAALAIARSLDLAADEATVLQSSNKLALRLLPCDVFARVAPVAHRHAAFEVGLAQALAGSPVAPLDPRVEPRGHVHDGFEVTLWTYCAPVAPEVAPAAYADALARLHEGLRAVAVPTPHFTDRVARAEEVVTTPDLSPALAADDRELLAGALRGARRAVIGHGAPEQLLHGEPNRGNVLATADGPVFVDLETCCRGPVEFDLAHVPEPVADRYPGVDPALLHDCRHLVLGMVAAWRWERDDGLPNGAAFGDALLGVLRAGPPWPTVGAVFDRLP